MEKSITACMYCGKEPSEHGPNGMCPTKNLSLSEKKSFEDIWMMVYRDSIDNGETVEDALRIASLAIDTMPDQVSEEIKIRQISYIMIKGEK